MDSADFEQLVAPYRRELHAHCYRMLGSLHDADDALQEAMVGAWRGLPGFEGRSSLRSWLYRIATNACLRVGEQRRRRVMPMDYGPAFDDVHELGAFVTEPVWLEPYPLDPQDRYEVRESVELAFVAALQYLPASQRAVLILREVLAFSAAEVAQQLEMSVASVNSALQRARKSLGERAGRQSQQAALRDLGEEGRRELVERLVSAWERADVPALLDLLVEDARFSMPPLPAWFRGKQDVGRFFAERVFASSWRLVPMEASGQPAFACYMDGRLSALNVVTLRDGRIEELTGFLDPAVHERFGIPSVAGP